MPTASAEQPGCLARASRHKQQCSQQHPSSILAARHQPTAARTLIIFAATRYSPAGAARAGRGGWRDGSSVQRWKCQPSTWEQASALQGGLQGSGVPCQFAWQARLRPQPGGASGAGSQSGCQHAAAADATVLMVPATAVAADTSGQPKGACTSWTCQKNTPHRHHPATPPTPHQAPPEGGHELQEGVVCRLLSEGIQHQAAAGARVRGKAHNW
jgi:hypothetical protein